MRSCLLVFLPSFIVDCFGLIHDFHDQRNPLASQTSHVERSSSQQSIEQWITSLRNSGYDQFQLPNAKNEMPTELTVSLSVHNLGNFRITSTDFEADTYLNQWWNDPRLTSNRSKPAEITDMTLIKKLWKPDLYFSNAKETKYKTEVISNLVYTIYPNGDVYYSLRVMLTVSCDMSFEHYPLDSQVCYIRLLSYSHSVNQLNALWANNSVNVRPGLRLTDLQFLGAEGAYCNGTYIVGDHPMEFSCLEANLKLQRSRYFHMLVTYLPTTSIVCVSWISFWIDATSVPGRVSLSITTLLTMSTQAASIHQQLPKVMYVKAIDIWMGTCTSFIFGSLVEFACVHMLATNHEKLTSNRRSSLGGSISGKRKAEIIDRACRFLFPVAFVLFNLLYWCYYLWPV